MSWEESRCSFAFSWIAPWLFCEREESPKNGIDDKTWTCQDEQHLNFRSKTSPDRWLLGFASWFLTWHSPHKTLIMSTYHSDDAERAHKYSDASERKISSHLALHQSNMKHYAAALLFVAPCVSSFTNTKGIINVSTRRQSFAVPPLLLHVQQMHDHRDTLVKLDDPITSTVEETSSYMPYDLLPPSVSCLWKPCIRRLTWLVLTCTDLCIFLSAG